MRKFVIHISEVLGRNIIVEAEDNYEAEEIAENLCNNGVVNLDCEDFVERNVEMTRIATDNDISTMRRIYNQKDLCHIVEDSQLNDKVFRLCFIRQGSEWDKELTLYFTEKDPKDQEGDDWDDIPYEHNAGEPYENDYSKKNEAGAYPKIEIKKLCICPQNYCLGRGQSNGIELITPRTGVLNSSYSVYDINNGEIPWLVIKENGVPVATFGPETTYDKFIKEIRMLPIKVCKYSEEDELDG